MKVAGVRYVGRSRIHTRRAPSDERYTWQRTTSGNDDSEVDVDNVEDAMFFDRNEVFEVDWTPLGEMVKRTDDVTTEVESALSDMAYRQKQQLAKSLGLKASGTEEEINERIEPEIKKLQEQMEVDN